MQCIIFTLNKFFLILFFAVGTDKPITFLIKAIRKCRIPKSDPHIFKVYMYLLYVQNCITTFDGL